jgi:hypothetical protein
MGPFLAPMRASFPWESIMSGMVREIARTLFIIAIASSRGVWLRFMRSESAPFCTNPASTFGDLEFGPIVQMIFVLRFFFTVI